MSPLRFDALPDGHPDAATIAAVSAIIPSDSLKPKRLANLAASRCAVLAMENDRPVGVAYVRTILGVPNITWIVAEQSRRRGIAHRLVAEIQVAEIQKDHLWLTAICRNEPSVRVARKSGFFMLGRLALWIASRR